jgi:predicted transcriptional regulator with HTH domain
MKAPKTKKITPSQYAALTYLSQHPSGDFYDLQRAGSGGGATTSKLVSLGLVDQTEDRGMKSWSITEDGAKAFASGRYSLANSVVSQLNRE